MIRLFLFSFMISIILTGCFLTPPSRSYHEQPRNVSILKVDDVNIDLIKPEITSVNPAKGWTNSGIFIENGSLVHVSASGKWSPAPLAWSGPEGNLLWAHEVSTITGGALMARLGHNGYPFLIGLNQTFRANDYGILYFAMNDPFRFLYDNEGEVITETYVEGQNARTQQDSLNKNIKIISYHYDDKSGEGSLAAKIGQQPFTTRQYLINKIGEIASSKNIAIKAGKEPLKGGNFELLDESSINGILKLKFKALW